MSISYTVADYELNDRMVEVTYTDSDGFFHKRHVNIPYLEDGSLDEIYFQEILDNQLKGIENKYKMKLIEFQDPNQVVGIAST